METAERERREAHRSACVREREKQRVKAGVVERESE